MSEPRRRWPAFLVGGALALMLVLTLAMNLYSARAALQFRTNVLWRDQWWFLGELQSGYEGKGWAGILWSPYWGHRPVIPRLLFGLDARWFGFRSTPLLCVIWAALLAQLALLGWVNRVMFGGYLRWRFAAALIVMLNLCVSSFQMENLIWALQVQYGLVFLFAVLSFALFAAGRRWMVVLAYISALAGSLTMANGLAIWPALAVQSALCRRRGTWGIVAMFGIIAGVYAIGYQMPGLGMGMAGQLKDPAGALRIALMVLAGPIGNVSVAWGSVAGALGVMALVVAGGAVRGAEDPAWPSVHVAVAVFAALTAWLTMAGRLTPELVRRAAEVGGEILPSRYLTFGLVFWTSVFALSLWVRGRRRIVLVSAIVPCYLMAAYARFHVPADDAWADTMRELDATGTSLLVGAADWERQKLLWGDAGQLAGWVSFAREHRLANFSEERLEWLGRALPGGFEEVNRDRCEGMVESFDALPDGAWRVHGWAWDREAGHAPLDIVLTSDEGVVRGLGRGGGLHHDTGGHSARVAMHRAGWLGYAKGGDRFQAYVVLQGGRGICSITRAR